MKSTLVIMLCISSWLAEAQTLTTKTQDTMNNYLLHGKLVAQNGKTNELADILLQASKLVSRDKTCIMYVVSLAENEPQAVYVTEIWESKQDHDRSLEDKDVRELIKTAIPLLAEQPKKGQELEVLGGVGIE